MKIAQLTFTPTYSGVAVMAWNIYSGLCEKYDVDIVAYENPLLKSKEKTITKNGSKYFKIKRFKNPILLYIAEYFCLKKAFKKNNYDVIHIHLGGNTQNIIALLVVRKTHAKIIVHTHNTENKFGPLFERSKKMLNRYPHLRLSCSDKAALATYGKSEYTLINNGIDTKKFKYSANNRAAIRKKLGIKNDQILIGAIGRIGSEKNYSYLVKIMKSLTADADVKMIILGDGPLRNELLTKIKEAGLKKYFIMHKHSDQIDKVLSALDYFVMPSRHEAFGISAVEAQACGLTTIISDQVPDMTMVTDRCKKLGIQDSDVFSWVNELKKKPLTKRSVYAERVADAGFDISNTIKQVVAAYKEN